jgi:hypothetical protein
MRTGTKTKHLQVQELPPTIFVWQENGFWVLAHLSPTYCGHYSAISNTHTHLSL